MGQVGDGFAFDGDDLVDAVGEAVQGGADLGDFGGAGGRGAGVGLAAGQAFRRTGCFFEWAGQAAGDEFGAGDAEEEDEQAAADQEADLQREAVVQLLAW